MKAIKTGISAQSQAIVNEKNTAQAIGSGSLEVFATPAMIALMENAATKCVTNYLDEGQTTVGTNINVAHIKASAPGDNIVATAKLIAIDGRKLTFEVEAQDNSGTIGKGTHERFIVDSEKFMSKLKQPKL